MPKDWSETGLWILEILAVNKKIAQYDLPEKLRVREVEKDRSTVFRQVRRLEKSGLVRFISSRESKRKGKRKHIYGITFEGILEVLATNISEIDQIAQIHKDKWLLFQEWDSFSADAEVKKFLVDNIWDYSRARTHSYENRWGRLTKPSIETLLDSKERENYKEVLNKIKQQQRVDAIWTVLRLDLTFALPPWLENPREVIVKLWKICWANRNIREFIEQQFEYEKLKHENLLKFEEYVHEAWEKV